MTTNKNVSLIVFPFSDRIYFWFHFKHEQTRTKKKLWKLEFIHLFRGIFNLFTCFQEKNSDCVQQAVSDFYTNWSIFESHVGPECSSISQDKWKWSSGVLNNKKQTLFFIGSSCFGDFCHRIKITFGFKWLEIRILRKVRMQKSTRIITTLNSIFNNNKSIWLVLPLPLLLHVFLNKRPY